MPKLTIRGSVGKGGTNNKDDMDVVLELLRVRRGEAWYESKIGTLVVPDAKDPKLVEKLAAVILTFQAKAQEVKAPDGLVVPNGNTILFLGGLRGSGKQIIVDQNDQLLHAYDGGRQAFKFDCASGDSKHATSVHPSIFSVTRKEKIYRSKKYDAQMNYAMFFSDDGKAIHQSNAVGLTSVLKSWGMNYFGSHGCVRLTENEAAKMFEWTPLGTTVFIDMSRKAFP
jgi:hypothetical protein